MGTAFCPLLGQWQILSSYLGPGHLLDAGVQVNSRAVPPEFLGPGEADEVQWTREIGQAWDWGRVAQRYDSPGDGLRQEVGLQGQG